MIKGASCIILVEYKTPHKLPLTEIIAGLSGDIRPAEDVINKERDDLEFLFKLPFSLLSLPSYYRL